MQYSSYTAQNEVVELYHKFDLIARKIIVLSVEKNYRKYDDFIDAGLPAPTFIIEHWKGYYIGWAINGSIKTNAQKDFYKDLALRLKKTFLVRTNLINIKISSIWALKYALESNEAVHIVTNQTYEMKDLAGACESLTTPEEKTKKLNDDKLLDIKEELQVFAGTYTKSEDALFDFIRFRAYDYAKINSINNSKINLEDLENYCLAIAEIGYEVIGGKGISTAYAKTKNIAEWVYLKYGNGKRKRKIENDKELAMTRRERALSNSKAQYEKAHKKIMNAITGIFADEYKKKNGTWNIMKLARELSMSKNTIKKHLQEEGII